MNFFLRKSSQPSKKPKAIKISSLANICFLAFVAASCSSLIGESQVRPGCIDENIADGYTEDFARDICEGEYLMYGNRRSPIDKASDEFEEATSAFECMASRDFDPEWEEFCEGLAERISGPAVTQNSQSPKTTDSRPTILPLDDTAKEACKKYNNIMAEIQKELDGNFADYGLNRFVNGYQKAVQDVWNALTPLGRMSQEVADSFNKISTATFGEYFRQGHEINGKLCSDD